MLFKKQGFSFLEVIIVLLILAVLSAMAVPKLLQRNEIAKLESSTIQLLSYLEMAASKSLRQGQKLHVHYIPKTTNTNGCIVFNQSHVPEAEFCADEENTSVFNFNESLKVVNPVNDKPIKLFSFSPVTGLPSNDLTLLLNAKLETGFESGIFIRRYKGLMGCSQTGMMNWQKCKQD